MCTVCTCSKWSVNSMWNCIHWYTHPCRVAEATSIWINTCKAELVKDAVFLQLLRDIQDGLAKDSLKKQQDLLNTSLADSIRSVRGIPGGGAQVNLGHAFKGRRQASFDHEIKLGISTVPAHSPQDKVPVRVHTVDRRLCRLQVGADISGQSFYNVHVTLCVP